MLTQSPPRRKLSNDEKFRWIDAVKCMMSKPALNGAYYDGARSRYGDFMALHIQAADYVHFNVSLYLLGQKLDAHIMVRALFFRKYSSSKNRMIGTEPSSKDGIVIYCSFGSKI